jgi:hypothetical protein
MSVGMVSSKHGARLNQQDLVDLDQASQHLATAAETIKRANPVYADSVIQLLIAANTVILRLQEKGAATFARYLEKHGLQKPQDGPEAPAVDVESSQEPKSLPGQAEEK